MKEKILEFIREINPYEEINADTSLMSEGILDSLTLVILIDEMESAFGVQIPESMLQPEYFENANQIAELIAGLLEKQNS